tara:strand:- start:429 stop:650 length:222 start_codon:yes stop_codon:yes gene_type:complete
MSDIPQYFAQIDENNICLQVHVVTRLFLEENSERYPGTWVETFVDLPNKTYAGPGFIYDSIAKDFSPPPPTVE